MELSDKLEIVFKLKKKEIYVKFFLQLLLYDTWAFQNEVYRLGILKKEGIILAIFNRINVDKPFQLRLNEKSLCLYT